MSRRKIIPLFFALLLTTACGDSGPAQEPTATETPSGAGAHEEDPPGWLLSMADPSPPAASCVVRYPDDLPEQPIAFEGTIASVQRGTYDEDAAATPVTVNVRVGEVFRGDPGETVTLRTWDYNSPGVPRQPDPIGVRLLAATTKSQDLMACGFTRPYSEQDAQMWREAFSGEAVPTPSS